jgi:NAD(P) transhydrogenase subunit alpha
VIIVGALLAAAASAGSEADGVSAWVSKGSGAVAAALAAVNIFGGFLVTQRMLAMYKRKDKPQGRPKS